MQDGVLIVNKAKGMTSHDVVQLARRKLKLRRIGHTGTLDPIAEGVLVLLVGRATKAQQQAQTYRKRYEATVRLGIQTDTGDAWGQTRQTAPVPLLARHEVEAVLAAFVGPLVQTPPPFSAVKVQGRPLYWWARKGQHPSVPSRTVQLFAVDLLDLTGDRLRIRVECSSGTYIRSLAEAIAQRLGTVGHVSELTRLTVGTWELADAISVQQMMDASEHDVWKWIWPLGQVHANPRHA